MSNLDSTISRMLSEYTGDAVIEPSEFDAGFLVDDHAISEWFDGDLSRRDTRRFMARSLAGAAVALGFIGSLLWVLP